MKALALLGLVFLGARLSGQVLITDDFSGSSLNVSRWTASTPFSDSTVAVSGGNLVLTDRGRVLTTASLPTQIDVLLAFQFTGSTFDSFRIASRTNGISTNGSAEFDSGVFASFRIQSDTGDTTNNVTLYDQNYPNGGDALAIGTFSMTTGQTYTIRYVDTGTNVSLYINDLTTPFLDAVTSVSYGNQFGFYNREGGGAGSSISNGSQVAIDSITISAVPEPTAYGITAGFVAMAVAWKRRKRK